VCRSSSCRSFPARNAAIRCPGRAMTGRPAVGEQTS
jgi:hypothetical protein